MALKPDTDTDPWGSHYFSLEIEKEEIALFMECTGFKSTADVFIIEEGGLNGGVHKRPGQSKWSTVTLKAAMSQSTRLVEWRDSFIQDEFSTLKTATGAIVMRATDGTEIRRYSMAQLWPVSWEGPQFNSSSSALALETVEIAFEQLVIGEFSKPTPPPKPDPEPEKPLEPIQFDFDKSNVKKSEEKKIDDASKTYKDEPAVWIEGHTCDMGNASYNATLSRDRAQSVADKMKSDDAARGVKRAAYNVNGYGYKYPVAPNDGEGNRARNRRVQIFNSPRSGKRPGELDYKSYKK